MAVWAQHRFKRGSLDVTVTSEVLQRTENFLFLVRLLKRDAFYDCKETYVPLLEQQREREAEQPRCQSRERDGPPRVYFLDSGRMVPLALPHSGSPRLPNRTAQAA